ncbi:RNA pseudouridine synthase [Alishewanella sp. 16-MA]|uniref:RNA pseudouridine synthase n=1 Tax=Alishewanella maricola TaxID=2795740 RepID=A0ABS8C0T9_9ALTE|nr:pseudouridine synthase [Alishewanella maricola]MCB5225925.1 RNA pseudouridine synthase [Alishewanella maricola]MDP4946377.1 pseudouridine synthase [Alishewanella sp.]MDP5035806.1 pseudouridine synthase [Alishewanella sp.]MDP5186736.1 pseudouridine synthase [Alishewanella sp.]
MFKSLTIVDSTADFVVINKPAGLSFHSEEGPGVVAIAEQQLGEKLFAVHRLDKVTSGLLLLARNTVAAAEFTQLFSRRQIQKCYLALSAARPNKKQGWVKGAMQPGRRGGWKLTSAQQALAVTYFVSQGFENLPFRAYLLRPYTGKTHQLRVALKSQGAPILGDSLYGAAEADRVYLHAYALAFHFAGTEYQYQLLPDSGEQFLALVHHGLPGSWLTPWQYAWPAAPSLPFER